MKALLSGAAIAAVAGMLMGAVAKPDLIDDGRPSGPQMMAGWGGGRATGPFDDGAGFAAYKGQIPDYVLGTDWKKSLSAPVFAEAAPEPKPVKAAKVEDEPAPLPVTETAYEDDTKPVVISYPSVDGGRRADLAPATDAPG